VSGEVGAALRDWPDAGSVARAAWPGLALAALLLVPFLGKAHTIDDATFLLQGRHVLADPLHPTAFDMVLQGERTRLSASMVTGPVMAYLLVPSVMLGGAEWAAHLVQMALMLMAVAATVALALRLGLGSSGGRLAGLLLASTPAAAVLATTAMPDVPAMAFGVIGVERYWRWLDQRRGHQAAAGAVALALAALSRPHLLLLLPVAAALPLATRGRRGLRDWPPVLGAAAIAVIVNRMTADPAPAYAGASALGAATARFAGSRVLNNLIAFSAHWVLVLPLALPWACARWKPMLRSPATWAALAAAATLVLACHTRTKFIPVAWLGLAVVADVLIDASRRRDWTQLVLGCWLLVALPAAGYDHLPSKYLIASAPAVALLVARLGVAGGGRARLGAAAAVVAGVALSLLVLVADARSADVGRRAARELIAPRVARGERVWVNAGWAFVWYGMRAGAIPMADTPPYPAAGDIVVSSAAAPGVDLERFPRRSLLERRAETSRLGRVMSRRDGAGFYSNWYGLWPWTWRNGLLDDVTVWLMR
jgi:hypothetical protein